MEFVVASMAQVYIENHTPYDFEFVLPLIFEDLSLRVIKFICLLIVAILAMVFLHCMYPRMPLSVQPPTEKVLLLVLFEVVLYSRRTTPINLLLRRARLTVERKRTSRPNRCSKGGVFRLLEGRRAFWFVPAR